MFRELENLSNTFSTITKGQAQTIIGTINDNLRNVLTAQIIDVAFREEGRDMVLLRHLASAQSSNIIREANPWAVRKNSKGIWPLVYYGQQPVWVENIGTSKKKGIGTRNRCNDDNTSVNHEVSLEDLNEIYPGTDSIMAVPLIFNRNVEGIYCIEFSRSEILNKRILELMERLAGPFASIIWKMKVNELNKSQSNTAINRFKGSISETLFREYLSHTQNGLFIRPFGNEYSKIEECVQKTLDKQHIKVEHYIGNNKGNISHEIATKIKLTPFGIADISDFNPNVMIELGMFQALSKDILLLINKDKAQELPFHIRNETVHHYQISGNEILISDPANGNLIKLEEKLSNFASELIASGVVHPQINDLEETLKN